MARMIPSHYDESVTSGAERRIFNLLKSDPDTATWTVLHSLGLARRGSKRYGEIDFVILVPGAGLVCLEVKGGRISCVDGTWYTTTRSGERNALSRSPFMQAREGMFALRGAVAKEFGSDSILTRCPAVYAVAFPDVSTPPSTPEFEPSQAIGFDELHAPISRSITQLIRTRLGPRPSEQPGFPTAEQLRMLREFLRPDFERVVAMSTVIREAEERLLSLTEEQYARLDELEANPRCFFEGAAGTGKTLLAVEFARRSALAGRETLLLCYNRILGAWMRERVMKEGIPTLRAGTFHSVLRELILATSYGHEFRARETAAPAGELFDEVYPFYGELVLAETNAAVDTLVVDEAQDLTTKPVLDVLNSWLTGGLAGGIWAMFGDFTRQAMFGCGGKGAVLIGEYCEHYTRARLTVNCRNTRRIGEETVLLSGFDTPPFRVGQFEGAPVEYHYWSTAEDQQRLLREVLERLTANLHDADSIVLLSPRRWETSVASRLAAIRGLTIVEVGPERQAESRERQLSWATVQAFKGMESPVVVVLDIDTLEGEREQSVIYVAMSRARSYLVMLLHENLRGVIRAHVRRKLVQGSTR